jgi:hypothetical protein
MTPPRDPDDVASALLDGTLDADQLAAARRDPEVMARVAAFTALRDAIADPAPAPNPVARDRAIAAALDAFDDESAGPALAPSRVATPTSIERNTGVHRRRYRAAPWLGAAAAVLLVVAGLSWLAATSDDQQDTATSDQATAEGADESTEGGAADAGAGASEPDATVPAPSATSDVDLGEVASADALADRVRDELAQRVAEDAGTPEDGEGRDDDGTGDTAAGGAEAQVRLSPQLEAVGCGSPRDAALLAAVPADAPVLLQGRASLAGTAVDVWVIDAAGGRRVIAVDQSCAIVADEAIDG